MQWPPRGWAPSPGGNKVRGSLDQGELPRGSDPEDDSGRMSQSLPDTQESVGSRGHGVSKK